MPNPRMSVEQLRQHVLQLFQQPDGYPFINAVEDYLAAVPQDDQMRANGVGALARKGLVSVAAELARACPPGSPYAADIRAVGGQLAQVASEVMAWSTTDAQFAANLEALRTRGDRGAELAQELEQVWCQAGPALTLHKANDGNMLVRAATPTGRRVYVPAALDFAGRAELVHGTEAWKGQIIPPLLIDGVGSGLLIPRLHAASQHTFLNYSPALYVVETNLQGLALVMRLRDWTALLRDERVFLFAGPSAWEQWRDALLDSDGLLPLPQQLYALPRWPGQPASSAQEIVREVREHFEALHREWSRRAGELYAGRDAAYWARRYASAGPDHPLRVLCLTSRFTTFLQHSMRDMSAALQRKEYVTRVMIEEKDYALLPAHAYLQAIAEFEPDLILMIDHHRPEYPGRFVEQVPFVCWIQDELPHLYTAEAARRLQPLDFTMGFGLTRCVLRFGYPPERFLPCKMAVNPAKFARRPGAGEPDPSLRCDVAYVSHHSETPEQFHARWRQQAGDEKITRFMDAFYEETRPLFASSGFNGAYDLPRLLDQVAAKLGLACPDSEFRERLLSLYIRPLADRTLRHTTLAWVADWAEATGRTFHLHGNGWDRHPRLACYARGPARHGEHLAQIARQATINLHAGANPALHQRVLETACAGGFVMVRYHPADFPLAAKTDFVQYLLDHGISQPAEIPLDQLPPAFVKAMRHRLEETGRQVPGALEVTPAMLLDLAARRRYSDAYEYASEAFPSFEQITFRDAEDFARKAEDFIRHPQQREAIVEGMREAVQRLFSYDGLVEQLRFFLTEALQRAVGEGPLSRPSTRGGAFTSSDRAHSPSLPTGRHSAS